MTSSIVLNSPSQCDDGLYAQSTSDWTHETSYRRAGASDADDRYEKNEGLTAMTVWLRLRMGADRNSPEIRGAARRLGWSLPCWNPSGSSVDFTAWFAGTRALWGRLSARIRSRS